MNTYFNQYVRQHEICFNHHVSQHKLASTTCQSTWILASTTTWVNMNTCFNNHVRQHEYLLQPPTICFILNVKKLLPQTTATITCSQRWHTCTRDLTDGWKTRLWLRRKERRSGWGKTARRATRPVSARFTASGWPTIPSSFSSTADRNGPETTHTH